MGDPADAMRALAAASLPPTEGAVHLPGLREPVEVLVDTWGVPHIYAGNTHDLFFSQGYVVASHRLFQIELACRFGAGRLSEIFGERTLPIDRFVRTVGWNRAAAHQMEAWDDLSWEMADAFVAGIRAWVASEPALPLEYQFLQLEPFPYEGRQAVEALTAAAILLEWSLSANWDSELLRVAIADRLGWEAMVELFPDLPTEAGAVTAGKTGGAGSRRSVFDLLRQAPPFAKGQGSNNWVVAGRRSVTGMPLLANDPHLSVQLPSVWFEIHLSAPGIEVSGVSLPWAPGVLIGHNERIAWGFTNVGGDTQDLYLERLSTDGTAALSDGLWEPLTVHLEEIGVRGQEPHVLEVRATSHGPILDSYLIGVAAPEVVQGGIEETYALRWVGLEEGTAPSVLYRLDTAENWEQFRSALADWAIPGQNAVYGDVDGNIGYQCTGWYPIRRAGDGTVPVPGWTSDFEWDGYVPFNELPSSYNPDEAFLATANQKIHGEDYPYLIGRDFLPPYRARRIAHRIAQIPQHDVESFRRIQLDTVSLPAMDVVPLLLTVSPDDDRQKQGMALLADWDFDLAAGSAAAALYEVWTCRIADAILLPRLGPELHAHFFGRRQWSNTFHTQVLAHLLAYPSAAWFGEDGHAARDRLLRRALDAALDELTTAMGEDMGGWSWGAIHRVRFAGPLAMVPDLAHLFVGGEAPWGGDEQTICQGMYEPGAGYGVVVAPSWRQVIDLSDLDASVGTNTVGQSGNPASRHFNDLFPLWSTGQYHPLPFTRSAVEAAAESRLELRPQT